MEISDDQWQALLATCALNAGKFTIFLLFFYYLFVYLFIYFLLVCLFARLHSPFCVLYLYMLFREGGNKEHVYIGYIHVAQANVMWMRYVAVERRKAPVRQAVHYAFIVIAHIKTCMSLFVFHFQSDFYLLLVFVISYAKRSWFKCLVLHALIYASIFYTTQNCTQFRTL